MSQIAGNGRSRTSVGCVRRAATVLFLVVAACAKPAGTASEITVTPHEGTEADRSQDLAIVRTAVVTEDDLPEGWVSCCGVGTYSGAELAEHICGSDNLALPAHTAGFDREFSLNLRSNGFEDGHLVEAVFLAPTEDAALAEIAAVNSPGYASCATASVARSARISVPRAVGEPRVTFQRGELPGGVRGVVDRFTSVFAIPEGSDTVFTAFIRMQVGRAIVRMPIMTYSEPQSDADLRPILDVAVERLTAALGRPAG